MTAAGDHVSVGIHGGAVGERDLFGGVAIGGESDVVGVKEIFVGLRVVVDADAEDGAAERRDAVLQLVQGLRFFDAGRAPGGPEIEEHDFAAKVGEMGGFAIEREGEVPGGGSAQTRLTLAIIGAREQEEKSRNEGEHQACI